MLKAGDIVRLKSGGPEMTVHSFSPEFEDKNVANPSVYARWFSGAKIEGDFFNPKSLLAICVSKRKTIAFKSGDVVTLVSGGPKMTVASVTSISRKKSVDYAPLFDDANGKLLVIPGEVKTSWFSGAKSQSSAFRPSMLTYSDAKLQYQVSETCTVEQVAYWMLNEVHQRGVLSQEVAAFEITSNFGQAFTYINANGSLAIQEDVLKLFRKLTEHSVVWEQEELYWRKRQQYDRPGRAQK